MKVAILHQIRGLVYTEVDAEDYEYANKLRLYVNDGNYVWFREDGNVFWLHRKLLGIIDPQIFVDHKDQNPLNNCRSNLRPATNSQNQMNSGAKSNRLHKLPKGVTKIKSNTKPYQAQIGFNRKTIYLGTFSSVEYAVAAREKAELELFKEFKQTGV